MDAVVTSLLVHGRNKNETTEYRFATSGNSSNNVLINLVRLAGRQFLTNEHCNPFQRSNAT